MLFLVVSIGVFTVGLRMSNSKKLAVSGADEDGIQVVLARNTLEGGGGLIRDALTYSTLLDRSLRIKNIRADRPGIGGLRVENTVAIEAMSNLSNAGVEGNTASSRTMTYSSYKL